MKISAKLSCATCRKSSGKLPAFSNETLGECAYRIGWRARCDQLNRFGDAVGWSQYCPICAPPDEVRPPLPSEREP